MKKEKWFKQTSPDDNLCAILLNFLLYLEVPFHKKYITEFLYSHESYPSLSSVKDLFEELNIKTLSVKISPEQLQQIQTPALTYLLNKTCILLIDNSATHVKYIDSQKGIIKAEKTDFINNWTSLVLLAEKNSYSGVNQLILKRRSNFTKLSACLLGLFLIFFGAITLFLENPEYFYTWIYLVVFNLIGLALNLNVFLKNFQSTVSGKQPFKAGFFFNGNHPNLGCDKCFKSFTLFGRIIHIEDSVTILFLGSFFVLSFFPTLIFNPYVALINNIVLFFFLFSFIYFVYDFFISSRQLCLPRVGILLTVIALISLCSYFLKFETHFPTILPVLSYVLCYSIAATTYFLFKKDYLKTYELKRLKNELNSFSRSGAFLTNFIGRKKPINMVNSFIQLSFGNKESQKLVTLILYPFNSNSLSILNQARELSQQNMELKFSIILYSNSAQTRLFAETIINNVITNGNEFAVDLITQWFNLTSPILSSWVKANSCKTSNFDKVKEQIDVWNKFVEEEVKKVPAIIIENRILSNNVPLSRYKAIFQHK